MFHPSICVHRYNVPTTEHSSFGILKYLWSEKENISALAYSPVEITLWNMIDLQPLSLGRIYSQQWNPGIINTEDTHRLKTKDCCQKSAASIQMLP